MLAPRATGAWALNGTHASSSTARIAIMALPRLRAKPHKLAAQRHDFDALAFTVKRTRNDHQQHQQRLQCLRAHWWTSRLAACICASI